MDPNLQKDVMFLGQAKSNKDFKGIEERIRNIESARIRHIKLEV